MSGFLSLYEGTERIDLGNGYWIDVKQCLTHKEKQRVQAELGAGRQNVDMSGRQFAVIDPNGMETEMIVQSVADWNLTDRDGEPLPLKPEAALRASVARLPAPVTSLVYQRCNELNGPQDRRDAAGFPGEPGGSGPARDAGTAGTGELPDPGGVLGAARGNQAEPGVAPVAGRGGGHHRHVRDRP